MCIVQLAKVKVITDRRIWKDLKTLRVVLAAHQGAKGVLGTESGFDMFVLPSFYDALGFKLGYQVLDTVCTPFLS